MRGVFVAWAVLFFGICTTAVEAQTKVSYGILFDNTGSMRQLIPVQQEIATQIVRKVAGSKVSIYGFSTAPDDPNISAFATGAECLTDTVLLEKQVSQIGVVRGQTTVLDAIHSGVFRLAKPTKPECGVSDEQILVVMSDGEDRASLVSAVDLVSTIKKSGVKVFVIGLLTNLSEDAGFISKSPMKKAKELLLSLAKETGGRIILPKKKATAEEIVSALFAENYTFPK